ncbi:DUF3237 family protein [Amycolatopsis sp. 195334CR]|uniref:DUF3237 family protein n=1 Tax=Amycolatopsis sp. 195334CR TaxID=2814588 RepID=UPI001A901880|nr:DUF3237 family protein [Amycolatopsis sp. 195334CR]MBN6039661.1 DUF3237 domain-containing protein [Amycolatopsis sp. 195334CR]
MTALVARLTVLIGTPVDAGPVPGGHRRIIPITGGSATGPHIEGDVLPLGADWNLMRPDGVAEVSARYLVRTRDGAVLTITNEGTLRFAATTTEGDTPHDATAESRPRLDKPPHGATTEGGPSTPVGITKPRIEAPAEGPYAWLNDAALVGTLTPLPDRTGVALEFHQAS